MDSASLRSFRLQLGHFADQRIRIEGFDDQRHLAPEKIGIGRGLGRITGHEQDADLRHALAGVIGHLAAVRTGQPDVCG